MITLTKEEFLQALADYILKRDRKILDLSTMYVDKVSENAYEFIVYDKAH